MEPVEQPEDLEKEKAKYCLIISRKLDYANRRLVQLKMEHERCLKWHDAQHEGLLLQAYFHLLKPGMTQLIVEDWESNYQNRTLFLDSTLSPQEQITDFFKKCQKLKSGLKRIPPLIERTDRDITRYNELLALLESQNTLQQLLQFCVKQGIVPAPQKAPLTTPSSQKYREYKTVAGLSIWVGQSSKDNDQLTFRFAKGSDWWLHVIGFAGSHVILREKKGLRPDGESIKDAIQLAIFHSKAKEESSVEICLTQKKYVHRIGKNQPGKVQLSKHETIYAKFDKERYLALLERSKKT